MAIVTRRIRYLEAMIRVVLKCLDDCLLCVVGQVRHVLFEVALSLALLPVGDLEHVRGVHFGDKDLPEGFPIRVWVAPEFVEWNLGIPGQCLRISKPRTGRWRCLATYQQHRGQECEDPGTSGSNVHTVVPVYMTAPVVDLGCGLTQTTDSRQIFAEAEEVRSAQLLLRGKMRTALTPALARSTGRGGQSARAIALSCDDRFGEENDVATGYVKADVCGHSA